MNKRNIIRENSVAAANASLSTFSKTFGLIVRTEPIVYVERVEGITPAVIEAHEERVEVNKSVKSTKSERAMIPLPVNFLADTNIFINETRREAGSKRFAFERSIPRVC